MDAAWREGHDEECLMVQGDVFLDDELLLPGDYPLAQPALATTSQPPTLALCSTHSATWTCSLWLDAAASGPQRTSLSFQS